MTIVSAVTIPILKKNMKCWNKARLERMRRRRERYEQRAHDGYVAHQKKERTYTEGDRRKNARLMLNALGSSIRLRMIERLAAGGAMSLTKLSEPLRLTLAAAQQHLDILMRAHLVVTHKRGRVRMCVYNRQATEELTGWLTDLGRTVKGSNPNT